MTKNEIMQGCTPSYGTAMNCLQIIGPPGTGKTQTLMTMLTEYLAHIPANEILFCSFTRAAVREAVNRVRDQLGILKYDLPYFGTIHSLCYRHLGMRPKDMMTLKKMAEFCKGHGLKLSDQREGTLDEPWEPAGSQDGDVFFAWYSWARNCLLDWEAAAATYEPPDSVHWDRQRMIRLALEYERFKATTGLRDFAQLLVDTLADGWAPPVQVLIVDESQDLSPLQRQLVLQWAAGKQVVFASDLDQGVYGFQGADPSWLLELPGETRFLEQSHRVPAKISAFAQRLIGKNVKRYDREWTPTKEQGELVLDADLEELLPRMATGAETWFLLARNNAYLHKYAEAMQGYGIPYRNLRGSNPVVTAAGSVLAALRLATGAAISSRELAVLARDIPAGPWFARGAKENIKRLVREQPGREFQWFNLQGIGAHHELVRALYNLQTCLGPLKLEQGIKDYLRKVYQRYGFKGFGTPWVTLSSIHGVKGQEADNVVLLPNVTRRTEDSYASDPEPERRVWYVGATRARRRLYVLAPTQGRFFEDW